MGPCLYCSCSQEEVLVWVTRMKEDRKVIVILLVGTMFFVEFFHVQVNRVLKNTWQYLTIFVV